MIIETRHDVGDMVYFLHNNKMMHIAIYKQDINLYEDRISTYLIFKDGDDIIVKPQDQVCLTQEELILSITQAV
jgi:hypothetical protein